jgi:hypothetical protein
VLRSGVRFRAGEPSGSVARPRTRGTSRTAPPGWRVRDTTGVVAPDAAVKREPTPIGALFEAAFRRYGAAVVGYTLWSILVGIVPAAIAIGFRDADWVLFAFVAAATFAHLTLCAILTALVTGTVRSRLAPAVAVSLVGAAVTGVVFLVAGPFALALYPVLVFGPIAAAAGDVSAFRAIPHGARIALGDWGRAYGVLLGLGLIAVFLWFAFFLALAPVGGSGHQIGTLALMTLVFSPVAALVERNLYGDATGRTVLPPTVSLDQRERGKKRRGK